MIAGGHLEASGSSLEAAMRLWRDLSPPRQSSSSSSKEEVKPFADIFPPHLDFEPAASKADFSPVSVPASLDGDGDAEAKLGSF